MDLEGGGGSVCNGTNTPAVVLDSNAGVKEDEEEAKAFLPEVRRGGLAGRRQRSGKRKVRWSDWKGKKLVEVLEFQPSDSSDSEDEYGDSCICAIL